MSFSDLVKAKGPSLVFLMGTKKKGLPKKIEMLFGIRQHVYYSSKKIEWWARFVLDE